MRNRALVLYWHGLGDIIQLTPHLRYLYKQGYIIDLMCMKQTGKSKLLDACPYVDKLIEVENTWTSSLGFHRQAEVTINMFEKLKKEYDWCGMANHIGITGHKIDFTSKELRLNIVDKTLEVFIPQKIEQEVLKYIKEKYLDGYIFVHTFIEDHKYHNWNALMWIKDNIPELPIVDTGYKGNYYKWSNNINASFVLLREAKYRVLSSSIFVHACDAMNVKIDLVNYGSADRKVWPINNNLILRIRENGKLIK